MATYVSLVNFTQQGVQNFKDTAERAEKFKTAAQKSGVTVKQIYWTLGIYDIVLVMEAPDDETIAAVMLNLAALGNVSPHTLRAFDAAELAGIIAKTK
jgi:uncharacterized protein with GYD domain